MCSRSETGSQREVDSRRTAFHLRHTQPVSHLLTGLFMSHPHLRDNDLARQKLAKAISKKE